MKKKNPYKVFSEDMQSLKDKLTNNPWQIPTYENDRYLGEGYFQSKFGERMANIDITQR